jgi:sigma-E factor negative regulatory protein RseC
MIEQQGTVVAAADGAAWVEVPRQSSCSACGQASACGTATLAQLLGNGRATRARVADHLGLRIGERVVIGIHGPLLARASLAAYLLPLVALIATASLAERAGLGDAWTALLGIGALLLGLWVAGLLAAGRLFAAGRTAECPAAQKRPADAGLQPLLLRRVDSPGVVFDPNVSRREPKP